MKLRLYECRPMSAWITRAACNANRDLSKRALATQIGSALRTQAYSQVQHCTGCSGLMRRSKTVQCDPGNATQCDPGNATRVMRPGDPVVQRRFESETAPGEITLRELEELSRLMRPQLLALFRRAGLEPIRAGAGRVYSRAAALAVLERSG